MECKEQLDQIKKIELDILRAFIQVCEELNLKYYLIGGTLLGAIRHQGFIPWDDDIDVGMSREDYEIFIKKGQDLLPSHLFIQNIYSDMEYLMCFSKIRNSKTTFIETSVAHHRINHGVFIDIFPLDYYPNNIFGIIKVEKAKWYNRRIACRFKSKRKNTFANNFKNIFLRLCIPSVESAKRKRDNIYKSMGKSSFLANYGGAWGNKEIVPIEWYGEGKKVIFEGIPVMVPTEYHKWLQQVYGDYMVPPPPSKQITHHYTEIIDLEKPYTHYM